MPDFWQMEWPFFIQLALQRMVGNCEEIEMNAFVWLRED